MLILQTRAAQVLFPQWLRRCLALAMRAMGANATNFVGESPDREYRREEFERALDRLDMAMAFFDSERRLVAYNAAYSRMWHMPEPWLNTRPSGNKILNRLRETQQLPERRNFNSWVHEHLRLNGGPDPQTDLWHLRDGRSINVTSRRYGRGGLVYLFEDVSKRLALERDCNSLVKVQVATLNALKDGIAIFNTAGRLTLYNNRFAAQWDLGEPDLANGPHVLDIALACEGKSGCGDLWTTVLSCISSFDAERYGGWDAFRRTDGSSVLLSLARLPDGATMAIVSDLVDDMDARDEANRNSRSAA